MELIEKLSLIPFEDDNPKQPTNIDLVRLIHTWGGPVAIYLCTSDYNIAVQIDKQNFVSQFLEFAPLNDPCKYRVSPSSSDEGKTLLMRGIEDQ